MKQSLQLRLLIGAAVAIFAALVVAWLAMTWLFTRHVEQREADNLIRNGLELAAGLRVDATGLDLVRQPADARFETPAGELFWQVSHGSQIINSRSLWDQTLERPDDAPSRRWRTRTIDNPYGARLLLVERTVSIEGAAAPILIQVAADTRPLDNARQEFGLELAGFLGVLWLVLSAAALAQVQLGLQPLARIRAELTSMKRNPRARLSEDHPREITPLTDEINAMAEVRQGDVERARRRAGDLAHSLKTPLAAIAAQTRLAREQGAGAAADGLDAAISAMGATIEAELARARAAATREVGSRSAPAQVAGRLIEVLERTDDGARVAFEIDVPDELQVPAPEDVLMEILGALLENAARHATAHVRLSAEASDQTVALRVEDDGQGMDDDQVQAAIVRGVRADEAGPGHGLGLAIARDLVQATDGTISLGKSDLGGLAIDLSWEQRA